MTDNIIHKLSNTTFKQGNVTTIMDPEVHFFILQLKRSSKHEWETVWRIETQLSSQKQMFNDSDGGRLFVHTRYDWSAPLVNYVRT